MDEPGEPPRPFIHDIERLEAELHRTSRWAHRRWVAAHLLFAGAAFTVAYREQWLILVLLAGYVVLGTWGRR